MAETREPRDRDTTWRQSPDGRALAADGDLERSLERPSPKRPNGPRLMELEPFLLACESLLPESLSEGRVRLGFLLFAMGAVDRFWSVRQLDDGRFQPYAAALLERFGLSADQAATLVAALPGLPGDAFALGILCEGGDVLESWLESRDPNVTLRLTELIAQWRQG
jgi:hypothetical protein